MLTTGFHSDGSPWKADVPKRVQRSRSKGSKLPKGTICVTRGTRWGNPFKVDIGTGDDDQYCCVSAEHAVECFRTYAEQRLKEEPDWLAPLKGKDLACWCGAGPCHADVLLELVQNMEKTDAK